MKKLILFVLTVCAVATAQTYKLKDGYATYKFPVLGPSTPVQYEGDYRVYEKDFRLHWTVTDSTNRLLPNKDGEMVGTNYDLAHVSFTTYKDAYIGMWYDIDGAATPGEAHTDLSLSLSDYGIYLLTESVEDRVYLSMNGQGVNIYEGDQFGVYYKDADGKIVTTTENWVGSFDRAKAGNHYDDGTSWYATEPMTTHSGFLCLFQGDHGNFPTELEWDHFEFGFVTAEPPSEPLTGQPLPGVMLSSMIGIGVVGYMKKRKSNK